jgi:inner membrane protein
MKLRASEVIRARVLQEVPGGKVVQVAPTPLNTILWRGLVETREGYFITYWSPFDSDNEIPQWDYYPKYRELAEKFKGEPLFEGLVWFSRGHWVARRDQESVVLIDMRFGELRDLRTQQQYPIFQWHMRYDEDGQFVAPSYRPQELDFKNSLGMIWNRLTGDLYSWQKIRTF